jgi:uncharacterized delta-60 repeat protein
MFYKIIIFAVISINAYSQVSMQWVRTQSAGIANDITVDASGNIYVTGSTALGANLEIITAKYSPGGTLLWQQTYNGPNSRSDNGKYIKLDPSGNVIVAGESYNLNGPDMVVIKYSSNGVFQWVSRYDGGGFGNAEDIMAGVAIDQGGNIYTAGSSVGSGTSYDIVIIKYTAGGAASWIVRYNNSDDRASGIVYDNNSNIYIGGETRVSFDLPFGFAFATLKYDTSGVFQWIKTYKSLNVNEDNIKSIKLDNTGNIVVTGTGSPLSSNTDYITIKYTPAGVQQWIKFYDGLGSRFDAADAMVIDNANNIIVTGHSQTSLNNIDVATIKYNPSGDVIWQRVYDNGSGTNDGVSSIVCDALNNYYLCGNSYLYTDLNDLLVMKYDSAGTILWKRTFNGGGNSNDGLNAVVLDNSQGIIGAGFLVNASSVRDFAVVKYSPSLFHDVAMGPFTGLIPQYFINNSYNIRSIIYGNSNTSESNFPVKFFINGVLFNTINYPVLNSGSYDTVSSAWFPVTPGVYELKYVSALSNDSNRYNDTAVTIVQVIPNINPTGSTYICRRDLHINILNLSPVYDTIYFNIPNALTVTDINVIIDTVFHTWDSDMLFSIRHLGISDSLITNRGGSGDNFIGTVLNDSAALSIAQGNAPFTGSFRPEVPLLRFNGLNPNGAWILKIDDVAGGDTGFLRSWCIQIVYSQGIGINEHNNNIPDKFALYQNYPNPFNPATKIKFDIPSSGEMYKHSVKLIVYDIMGREVQTLVNEPFQPGTYEADFDGTNFSSGIYYYKLIAGSFAETKKMVLLK